MQAIGIALGLAVALLQSSAYFFSRRYVIRRGGAVVVTKQLWPAVKFGNTYDYLGTPRFPWGDLGTVGNETMTLTFRDPLPARAAAARPAAPRDRLFLDAPQLPTHLVAHDVDGRVGGRLYVLDADHAVAVGVDGDLKREEKKKDTHPHSKVLTNKYFWSPL